MTDYSHIDALGARESVAQARSLTARARVLAVEIRNAIRLDADEGHVLRLQERFDEMTSEIEYALARAKALTAIQRARS